MPRLPIRFPSYTLPPVTFSSSSTRLEGWEQFNAIYGRNLQELELANPYVRMIPASTQGISTAGFVDITLVSESTRWPRQSMDPVSTGSFLEIPFDGVWTISAQVTWDISTVGEREVRIQKTEGRGSTGRIVGNRGQAVDNNLQPMSASVPLYKGDRVRLQAIPTGGGAVAIIGGEGETFIEITGVGIRGTT